VGTPCKGRSLNNRGTTTKPPPKPNIVARIPVKIPGQDHQNLLNYTEL
jgi:hypothetical protein